MNIFVAKLGRNVTAEDLQRLFSTYGEVVSAKIVADRFTGVSKGYGFVEMVSEEDGENAINSLNETTFMETTIVTKKAHPREEPAERKRHVLIRKKSDQENSEDHQPEHQSELQEDYQPEHQPDEGEYNIE